MRSQLSRVCAFVLSGIFLVFKSALAVVIPAAGQAGGAIPDVDIPVIEPLNLPDIVPDIEDFHKVYKGKPRGVLIPVQRIVLKDFIPYHDYGITQERISELAESLRFKLYRPGKGLTLEEIQLIAYTLTKEYRRLGLILTRVIVPPQEVDHRGVIKLQIVVGKLGNISVEGNHMYRRNLLVEPFTTWKDKPIAAHWIENGLMALNGYPGLQVFSVFKKGTESKETDLILKIKSESRYHASFGADNTGTSLTGRVHGFVNATINNLSHHADSLSGTIIENADPRNGTYGSVAYERKVYDPNTSLKLSFLKNDYDLGGTLSNLNYSGILRSGDVTLKHFFQRDRTHHLAASLIFSRQQTMTEQNGNESNKDNRTKLKFALNSFNKLPTWHMNNDLTLTLDHGFNSLLGANGKNNASSSRSSMSGKRASGEYDRVALDWNITKQTIPYQSIKLNAKAQYSRDLLTSLEQFSLGGVRTVRAYPASEHLGDYGVFGSLEYTMGATGFSKKPAFRNFPWGQVLQFTAFVDYGTTWVNDPSSTDEPQVTIAGYGVGMHAQWPGKFVFSLEVAKPFKFAKPPTDGDEVRYWLKATYSI